MMRPAFLAGVRVADFTWAGAGPFGTKVLSDFGAEVIKIESAARPDSVRTGGPFRDRVPGIDRSGYFASRNTGKQSVTLDLKTDEGRAVAHALIRRSDVVANNFAPGAMDRMGVGWDVVRRLRPDAIWLEMPMYGAEGPRATLAGVGMTISAVTGLMWSTAHAEGDPIGPGTHYPDHAANPYHAAFAVLAALRRRRRTGQGLRIELSQVESTLNFVGPAVVAAAAGQPMPVTGNAEPDAAPHGIYRAAGPDSWVAIAVSTNEHWRAFCTLIGASALAEDPSLATGRERAAQRARLDALAEGWTRPLAAAEAAAALRAAGIPAAVVANARDLIEDDAHLAARQFWQRVPHPELGNSLYAAPPPVIDGARVALERPPLLGEHTDRVLSSVLGMDSAAIARLRERGALR